MKKDGSNILYSWIFIIIGWIIFWPIGIFLLIKRFEYAKKHASESNVNYLMNIENAKCMKIVGMAMCLFAALGLAVFAEEGNYREGVFLIIFFASIGIGLLKLSNKKKKDAEIQEQCRVLVVNVNKRKIDEIASNVGILPKEAEKYLQRLVNFKIIKDAYINMEKREVVVNSIIETVELKSHRKVSEEVRVATCKSCGGNNTFKGNVGECKYCGSPIK